MAQLINESTFKEVSKGAQQQREENKADVKKIYVNLLKKLKNSVFMPIWLYIFLWNLTASLALTKRHI